MEEEIKFTKWENAPILTPEESKRIACEFDEQGMIKWTGVQERWDIQKSMLSQSSDNIQKGWQ